MFCDELMIGDWVQFADGSKNCEVVGINLAEEVTITVMDSNGHWLDKNIDELRLIQITPEILEKNGFKKHDFVGVKKHHKWSFWFGDLSTPISISLWCRELNDYHMDGWMVEIHRPLSSLCVKVDYVHELQHAIRLCKIVKEITI